METLEAVIYKYNISFFPDGNPMESGVGLASLDLTRFLKDKGIKPGTIESQSESSFFHPESNRVYTRITIIYRRE